MITSRYLALLIFNFTLCVSFVSAQEIPLDITIRSRVYKVPKKINEHINSKDLSIYLGYSDLLAYEELFGLKPLGDWEKLIVTLLYNKDIEKCLDKEESGQIYITPATSYYYVDKDGKKEINFKKEKKLEEFNIEKIPNIGVVVNSPKSLYWDFSGKNSCRVHIRNWVRYTGVTLKEEADDDYDLVRIFDCDFGLKSKVDKLAFKDYSKFTFICESKFGAALQAIKQKDDKILEKKNK